MTVNLKNLYSLFLVIAFISCNSSNKQSFQSESVDTWQIENYTDKWGEKTNLSYVWRNCEGTFSNSAVTDAPLTVEMLINKKDISIRFLEYGDNLKKGEGDAIIIVRDKDKKEYNDRDYYRFQDGSFGLSGRAQSIVRKALLKGGRVMFIVGIRNNGIQIGSYHFEVSNADGLKEALAKTKYYK